MLLRTRSLCLALVFTSSLAAPGCATSSAPPASRLALRDDLRAAWTTHALWTRGVVVSTLAGLPDLALATARLHETPTRIGDVVRAHYGAPRAAAIEALLRRRIDDTIRWLAASRSGDVVGISSARAACRASSDALAHAFADLDPALSFDDLAARLDASLDETLADATARDAGDWSGDIAVHDAIVAHATDLADVLASAIATQHPEQLAPTSLDARAEELHVRMRALWQAHARWMRSYLVATIAGLPDASVDLSRLLLAQDDIGDAIRAYVGDADASTLTQLLRARVAALAELADASMSGDAPRLAAASATWYAAGDALASSIATSFPASSRTRLVALTYEAADQTAAETFSRVHADWHSDIVAYDAILDQSSAMADEISTSISTRYPD